MEQKVAHFMYVPFVGLGLYNGFRGNRWLKNRIKVFEQFVLPSLEAQTNKNFIVWCSWRHEERSNKIVKEFIQRHPTFVNTFSGVAFYDDKYPDDVARERLINAIHGSMGELINVMGDAETILMTLQPSDDCYHNNTVQFLQNAFKENQELQAMGFSKGFIMNYATKEVREYTPLTNPPFYTIKFPREIFIDPLRHVQYTSLKHDVGKYKAGTPLPSHEYVKDCLNYGVINERGFLVGCHGENISTTFKHPYAGEIVSQTILQDFGLYDVEPLKISYSIRKRILRMLPHKVQRKLRYWFGELLWQRMYNWLRS